MLYLTSSSKENTQTNGGFEHAASPVRIHIYERLKTPHGLVRYGVAPDHPEVKNCIHKFDRVIQDPRVRYFGNVHVGGTYHTQSAPPTKSLSSKGLSHHHIPLSNLFPHYTHLAFATGAPIPKTHSRLLPSQYCVPALDIVHWYTGHPESRHTIGKVPPISPTAKHVTVIGHGNVSLDVVRMILSSPDRLRNLDDMPANVKGEMEQLGVKHVEIVGRRGPEDVRFTPKEVREIMSLESAVMDPIPPQLFERIDTPSLSRQQTRIVQLLQKGSKIPSNQSHELKTFSMRFFEQPVGYRILEQGLVELELEETCVAPSGDVVPANPPRRRTVHTNLIVTSLGYESSPALFNGLEGIAYPWFDERSKHIRTLSAGGRVLSADGRIVRNVYASGWAGRGAHGVLAGTVIDANDVASAIVQDWRGEEVKNGDEESRPSQEIGSKIRHVERLPTPLASEPSSGLDAICEEVEQGIRDGTVYPYTQS